MKAIELLNELKSQQAKSSEIKNEKLIRKQNEVFSMIKNKNLIQKHMENYIKDMVATPIYNILNSDERSTLKDVLIDSISINKINARTFRTNENEYLIIITNRLMGLLHTWNEIQFKINMMKNPTKEEVAKAFAPIVDSYLTPNSNQALPIYSFEELPIEYSMLATMKTVMHEQFILAHELAHIYFGHLSDTESISSFASDFKLRNFYENTESIKKEFEADIQAVKWISRMKNANKCISLYVEALVIFHYIECNTSFPSSKATHPASLLRLMNIRDQCNNLFSNCEYPLDEMINNCLDIESFRITHW